MTETLYRAVSHLSRYAVWIGGFTLLAVALLVAADVVSRKWFGATLAGSDEISGYVLAVTSAWAYSYCLLQRAHIRIDVTYNLAPPSLRGLFDIIGLVALMLFMAFMTYRAVGVLTETLETGAVSNTPLLTPLWIPQSLWVAGLIFFSLTLIVVFCHAVFSLWNGDYRAVTRVAGIPTVEEEIETETGLERRAGDGQKPRIGGGP